MMSQIISETKKLMQDYLEYIQSVFDIIKELKEYNPDLTEQFYREYEANLGSAC